VGGAVGGYFVGAAEDDGDDVGVGRDLQRQRQADQGAVPGADQLPVGAVLGVLMINAAAFGG
jgi:hypothetical protein